LVAHFAAVMSLQMVCGSAPPAATAVQRPASPLMLQLWHAPVQVVAQQTPSAQWPFWHSASALQVWPSAFRPQLPTVAPAATVQTWPSAQSVLLVATVQLSVQAPPVQRKLVHMNGSAAWHMPRPSQVRVLLPSVASTHTAAAHGVFAG
jgi:hypothetical protein